MANLGDADLDVELVQVPVDVDVLDSDDYHHRHHHYYNFSHFDMASLRDAGESVEFGQVPLDIDILDSDDYHHNHRHHHHNYYYYYLCITTASHLDVAGLGDSDEGVELEEVPVDLDALVAEELVALPALERGQDAVFGGFALLAAHGTLRVGLAQVQAYHLRRQDEVGLKG